MTKNIARAHPPTHSPDFVRRLIAWMGLQVVHVDCPYGGTPPQLADTDSNYHRGLLPGERPWRRDLRPLDVVQPDGPSYTVNPPSPLCPLRPLLPNRADTHTHTHTRRFCTYSQRAFFAKS